RDARCRVRIVAERDRPLHDRLEGRPLTGEDRRVETINDVARAARLRVARQHLLYELEIVHRIVALVDAAETLDRSIPRVEISLELAACPEAIERAAGLRTRMPVSDQRLRVRIAHELL